MTSDASAISFSADDTILVVAKSTKRRGTGMTTNFVPLDGKAPVLEETIANWVKPTLDWKH